MIYLDNAATSFHKPPGVVQAVAEAFSYVGNAGRGGHGATLDTARMIFNTRMLLAELLPAGLNGNTGEHTEDGDIS